MVAQLSASKQKAQMSLYWSYPRSTGWNYAAPPFTHPKSVALSPYPTTGKLYKDPRLSPAVACASESHIPVRVKGASNLGSK